MAQIQAIKGFADQFPAQSRLFEMMETTAREVFPRYGFGELRTPLMEYTDLFCRGIGTETDVATGEVTKLDYPESDVLYFAMEGGHFVCVRPSGTEPKIKLYVNVNDRDQARAQALLEHLTAEAQKLLK